MDANTITIDQLRKEFPPSQNVNVIHHQRLTDLDKLALYVTEKIEKIEERKRT